MYNRENPLRKIKSFVPDLSFIEEPIEGLEFSYESDPTEEVLTSEGTTLNFKVANPNEVSERFAAFLDGTYKTARMGYLSGIPVYIASISGALLTRDDRGYLHDTGLLKNIIAILFPYKSAIDYHEMYGDSRAAKDIEEFVNVLRSIYPNTIYDHELKGDALKKLEEIDQPTVYVIADTSYRGLDEKRRSIQINPEQIYDLGLVYRKARVRTRVLMSILEAAYLKRYRDEYGFENWVLVDGTLNYTYKFFLANFRQDEEFRKYFKNTVGFVKTIRRRVFDRDPRRLMELFSMDENQYIISVAYKTDTEEDLLNELEEPLYEGSVKWGFVYLRFRVPRLLIGHEGRILTNKGLIKLQFIIEDNDMSKEEIIKKGELIANMACFEKYPLPSDRRRVWNEALAIEEAEKVAKARVHNYRALEAAGVHMVF